MPNYSGTPAQYARQNSSLSVAIGMVLPWAAPSGSAVPDGWLVCDGRPVLKTAYPTLFSVIGQTHGDGTKNANGTPSGFLAIDAFNLPDYRGRFVRGADNMAGVSGAAGRDSGPRSAQNTGGSASAVGSIESDTLQGHWHQVWTRFQNRGGDVTIMVPGSSNNFGQMARNPISDGVNGTPRPASESRPLNMAVQFIVRAY